MMITTAHLAQVAAFTAPRAITAGVRKMIDAPTGGLSSHVTPAGVSGLGGLGYVAEIAAGAQGLAQGLATPYFQDRSAARAIDAETKTQKMNLSAAAAGEKARWKYGGMTDRYAMAVAAASGTTTRDMGTTNPLPMILGVVGVGILITAIVIVKG